MILCARAWKGKEKIGWNLVVSRIESMGGACNKRLLVLALFAII